MRASGHPRLYGCPKMRGSGQFRRQWGSSGAGTVSIAGFSHRQVPPLMKPPKSIAPLIEDGVIDEVIRPLMSGKEAAVYVVRCGDDVRCAKVYKSANNRGFRNNTQYLDGRKVRNSRKARAMERGSRYGREEREAAWQNAEVDALFP